MARDLFDDVLEYLRYSIDEGQGSLEMSPATAARIRAAVDAAVKRQAEPLQPTPAPADYSNVKFQAAETAIQDVRRAESRVGAAMAPVEPKVAPVVVARKDRVEVEVGLAAIVAEVAACKACPLHEKRTRTVPGQGACAPDIMFIGEAPGEDEDKQGLAFVGRAGQLLTKMILAMGYSRDEVFIANICKCRPPGNRQPADEEMAACLPYLKRQIELIRPKVIVALGATALKGLFNKTGIMKLRGTWESIQGIDVMLTYHPAYLLRNPPSKREVWEDLKAVLARLGRTPPPVPRK